MKDEALYKHNSLFNRRDFLKLTRGTCAGFGLSAFANTILHQKLLAAVTSTQNLSDADDYKALVCVFLLGGNDGMNCFIPTSPASFANYTRDRNEVALPLAQLHQSTKTFPNNETYGFHPELPFFRDAFDAGRLAVVANVGTLIEPVTKAQFFDPRNGGIIPPQLFSHSDQQMQWQTSLPGRDSVTGWGGRLGDAAQVFNENGKVSISVSVGESNIFSVGNQISRLDLGGGAVTLTNKGPNGILQAAQTIRDLQKPHVFEREFANITRGSIAAELLLRSIINNTPGPQDVGGKLQERDNDVLFQQLRSVTQMINARESLGVKRQIFFVTYPNFDTHGTQIAGQATQLNGVNRALQLFYQELDALNLGNNVTTFTVTDFGRTYTSNAAGTDHGWGNNHFVIGGAVDGGKIFGALPSFQINGPDDTGFGRWIPSISTDEYASTFAKWFGVADSEIPSVVPNIGRFARRDLGFMKATV